MVQKQPPRGVPRKRCSENMQQIYRRTPMPKCDFNKVAKQSDFIEFKLRHECSPVNWCIFSEHLFLRTPLGGCFWWLCTSEAVHSFWRKTCLVCFSHLKDYDLSKERGENPVFVKFIQNLKKHKLHLLVKKIQLFARITSSKASEFLLLFLRSVNV